MSGANVARHAWNTFESGGVTNAQQELMVSLGSGWLVTRMLVTVRLVLAPQVFNLPATTTGTSWPQLNPITMIAGVQSGPTGYGPIAPTIANLTNSDWWFVREISGDSSGHLTYSNPPYVGDYLNWEWQLEYRFGLKPQAVPQDFYFSFGWDNPAGVSSEFYSTGSTELWYG